MTNRFGDQESVSFGDQDVLSDVQAVEAMPKWQLLLGRMHLVVRFADFRRAANFVAKIGEMAEDANHHPEIDIRWNRVHLALNSHDLRAISGRDVRLANAIVPVVKVFDGQIDDGVLSETQVTIDARDSAAIMPFWAAAYGYKPDGDDLLLDPAKSGPQLWFQEMNPPRTERSRVHLDIYVPAHQAESRISRMLDAGGRMVTEAHAPSWWVLADPEGNEACICTWQSRTGTEAPAAGSEG